MRKRMRFIINPRSGGGKYQLLAALIEKEIDKTKFDIDMLLTEAPKHATKLAEEAAMLGYDHVVAVGGDGTVNEVGRALIGKETSLGIIPAGSGNGLARTLKIRPNPIFAIRGLNRAFVRVIDTGTINNEVFLGTAGIGFDAHIASLFSKLKTRGLRSYVRLIGKEFGRYKAREYQVIYDGQTDKKISLMLTFANANQFGNEAVIAPQSVLDDGQIDVCMLKKFPLYVLPALSLKLFTGKIQQSVFYDSFKCKSVKVIQKETLAHIDGEPVEIGHEIEVKAVPQSLKMFIPEY